MNQLPFVRDRLVTVFPFTKLLYFIAIIAVQNSITISAIRATPSALATTYKYVGAEHLEASANT